MNLYLIGFRGCGKSTVAPLIAAAMGWKTIDSDRQIEILTGRSIADIFAEEGEAGFRRWETNVIQQVAENDDQVIALGGGAPTIRKNRNAIKRSGRVVLLTASPEILWVRISADARSRRQRPSLTDLDGFNEVKKLLELRDGVYKACADYTVDTSELQPQEIADNIVNWWDPVDT